MNPQGFAGLFGFVVAPSCFRDGAGGGAGGESGLLPSAVGLGGGVGVFVVSDSFQSAGGEGVGGIVSEGGAGGGSSSVPSAGGGNARVVGSAVVFGGRGGIAAGFGFGSWFHTLIGFIGASSGTLWPDHATTRR